MTLATLGLGFAQPVHDAQQVFRALLQAMSRPGRVQTLPSAMLAPLEPPELPPALTAALLCLLDGESTLWLAPALGGAADVAYLRFHTGVRMAAGAEEADFVVGRADDAPCALWATLQRGSDEAPQLGATMVLVVPRLQADPPPGEPGLLLSGPGIDHHHRLAVGGLPPSFWQARAALAADYPRGIDLLLCCGPQLAALPRTTRVVQEG